MLKEDGQIGLNWTDQRIQNGRSCINVDGKKDSKWTLCEKGGFKWKKDGPENSDPQIQIS